jgi:hypothetical protein
MRDLPIAHAEDWMQTMQKVLTIAVAALVLAAGTSGVLAQGKGKGGNSQSLQGNTPNWDKGERKGWKESDTPPGWTNEQAQRKGWNGQNVPPGFQAK